MATVFLDAESKRDTFHVPADPVKIFTNQEIRRANSSAVEHLVYTEAVGGSNPSSRTFYGENPKCPKVFNVRLLRAA